MFSKTWNPQKDARNNWTYKPSAKGEMYNKEQREKLGLSPEPIGSSAPAPSPSEPTGALQKLEFKKAKQDAAISDLSNRLGDLKGMAVAMGGEIHRQDKELDHLSDGVEEMDSQVEGANQNAGRLSGK